MSFLAQVKNIIRYLPKRIIMRRILMLAILLQISSAPLAGALSLQCRDLFVVLKSRAEQLHIDQWKSIRQQFEATAEAHRDQMTHPVFTQLSSELLEFADGTIASKQTSFNTEVEKKFVLDYLAELHRRTKQNMAENGGEVTHEWLVSLGIHVANLQNILLGKYKHSINYSFGTGDNLKVIDQFFKVQGHELEGYYRRAPAFRIESLLLPTEKNLTVRDILGAQSNGIALIGIADRSVEFDGNVFDPMGFLEHDFGHEFAWLGAVLFYANNNVHVPGARLKVFETPGKHDLSSDNSLLFFKRFRSVLKSVDMLPSHEREPAEYMLFMLLHEIVHPEILSDNISEDEMDSILKTEGSVLETRLANKKDFGQDFPGIADDSEVASERRQAFVRVGTERVKEILSRLKINRESR